MEAAKINDQIKIQQQTTVRMRLFDKQWQTENNIVVVDA